MKMTMRKSLFYLFVPAMIWGLVACSESDGPESEGTGDEDNDTSSGSTDTQMGTDSQLTVKGGVLLKSDRQRDMNPTPTQNLLEQLSKSNTAFATDMYAKLAKDNDANLFFSPFSLSAGMALSYGGARNETEKQMAETLHFSSFSQEELHLAFNRILLDLDSRSEPETDDDGGFELSISNSLWGQKDFPFLSDYLDLISVNYDAGIYTTDFEADLAKAIGAINDFVAEKTKNKILDILDPKHIELPVYSVLVNAIYFKAAWNLPFKKEQTTDKEFTLLSGDTIKTAMMAQSEHFSYGHGDGYEAVSLPYDGESVDMVIIAPVAGTFNAFEENLDSTRLDSILQNMAGTYSTWVTLNFPKFHIASKWEMEDLFMSLGMEAPFGDDADFSGMTERFIRIKKIIHQTDIVVDEAGTEAAAATVIVDGNGDADYVDLNLNRPFIFMIRDVPTGTILFMGRVTNPNL